MTRDTAVRYLVQHTPLSKDQAIEALAQLGTNSLPTVKRLARKVRDGLAVNMAVRQLKGKA